MNQILDYSQNTNKSNYNRTPNYNSGRPNKGGSGSDNIVRVFAIILILFAIALIVVGVVGKMGNDETQKEAEEQTQKEDAVIKLVVDEESNNLTIDISHTKNIEKVIYKWNNNREKELKSKGGNTLKETIPLPVGKNTLTIKVIDAEGNETTEEKVFNSTEGTDITSPQLSLVPSGNKLVITATDEKAIDKISYKWSNQEETYEVAAEEEGQTEIVHEVEILRGENDIFVTAADKAGNVSTESRTYKGVTVPEVLITVNSEEAKASIRVTHEVGITSIKIGLNGETYDVGELDGTQKDVTVDFDIDSTIENKVTVTAVSTEGTETNKEEILVIENQNPPVIEVSQDGENVNVTFKAEAGILKAELFMQEQNYTIGELESNPKEAFINFAIPQGTTRVVLTMTDMNGNEAVFDQELTFEG